MPRRVTLIALATVLLGGVVARAETRVALVIGNDQYAALNDLKNAGRDATAMAEKLTELGFETTLKLNIGENALYDALAQFKSALQRGNVGLFYYAGHGIGTEGGRNYLIPADAELKSESDLLADAIDTDVVLNAMAEARNELNIMILDACRDNPLPETTRTLSLGLAKTVVPDRARGMAVMYSAAPGQKAQDGPAGGHGVFTGELLRALDQPGLLLEQVFKEVVRGVLQRTNDEQRPWNQMSLEGDFFFNPTESDSLVAPGSTPTDPGTKPQSGRAIVDELDEFRWTTQAVDVYADPSDASAVLLSLEPLVEVNVIGAVRGAPWLRVAPDDGGTGYVAAAALSDQYPVVDADGVYRVVRRANVRGGPGVTYDAVSRLDAGTDVRVTGKFLNTDWLRVVTASGEGYVKATALSDQFRVEAASGIYRATRRTDVRSGSGIGWETVARLEAGDEVEVTGRLQVMGEDWLRVAVGSGRVGYVAAVVLLDVTVDDEAYARARGADTSAAYGEYLRRYPSGRHVEEVRRLQAKARDDEAFARAKTSETVAAYGSYLRTYPNGRHAAEARRLQRQAEEKQRLRPGRRFQDCEECPEMVVVPAGSFMMGSPTSEDGRGDDEGPRQRVRIGEQFAVGVYEVTFAEWDACARSRGCGSYRPDDEGWGRGRRPVIRVSWEDAQAYVRWLSRRTGREYRLLSEAEWEYVARAGTTTPFHTGRTISTDQANYNGNFTYGTGREGKYRKQTVPVGLFAPNAFGLHDVHGNVREWTQDCWNDSYTRASSDGDAWERGDCSRRVVRGGSWGNVPWNLRSANRVRYSIEFRINYNGFRVARTLTS